jgi:DNA excision repair protein ERCC-8
VISFSRNSHRYALTGIQWFPCDTGMFITSSLDHSIRVWDTNQMNEACAFNLHQPVYSIALSPIATSHTLIAGRQKSFSKHSFQISDCLLGGSADPKIRLCDLRSAAATHHLLGTPWSVSCRRIFVSQTTISCLSNRP